LNLLRPNCDSAWHFGPSERRPVAENLNAKFNAVRTPAFPVFMVSEDENYRLKSAFFVATQFMQVACQPSSLKSPSECPVGIFAGYNKVIVIDNHRQQVHLHEHHFYGTIDSRVEHSVASAPFICWREWKATFL
tara:strand:- start:128137 stop:128538 length:402 start_codon:yes stop_codon:yes gene_type:complete